MWPHFETWRGGLEWARGDTERSGGGGGEEEEEEEGCGEREEVEEGSFPLFSSPQLFYEGRNIIFSTQASPRCDL